MTDETLSLATRLEPAIKVVARSTDVRPDQWHYFSFKFKVSGDGVVTIAHIQCEQHKDDARLASLALLRSLHPSGHNIDRSPDAEP